jgi:hypothetical protein
MLDILQCQLLTMPIQTSGWTAISSSGRPLSYIRELAASKVEPPIDSRTLVLLEAGAQCTLVIPFLLDGLSYLETHIVEIPIGQNITKKSTVVGGKFILDGVELRTNQLSEDRREMLLVFMEGASKYEIGLDRQGLLNVKRF